MCTALRFKTKDMYFGRTLDLDCSYGERVCILPRKYILKFRNHGQNSRHYAIIGMASVIDGVPLFYDGANERGLCCAALNFPENAYYERGKTDKEYSIAPFELISWVLGQCADIEEARSLLKRSALTDASFSKEVPNSPLHFMFCDKEGAIAVEPRKDGLLIYDDPIDVLTNNPPFPFQLENLKKYSALRADNQDVRVNEESAYSEYSQGLGAVGLPGDVSSKSRFVRIAFGSKFSVRPEQEREAVGQFFHLMSSVEMVKGLCLTDKGTLDHTVYTSCINADKGLYYYTTYDDRSIRCVDMYSHSLDSSEIAELPIN